MRESHDRALEVSNYFEIKNEKLKFVHAKLLEDFEHLEMAQGSLRVSSSNSPSLMLKLKLLVQKSLPSFLLLLLLMMMLVLLTLLLVKHPF